LRQAVAALAVFAAAVVGSMCCLMLDCVIVWTVYVKFSA